MRLTTPALAKSAIVALAAATVALSGTPASAATSAGPEPAALRCGFYSSGFTAYYGHCDTPPRTDVIIRVVTIFDSYELCVKPGVTTLGPYPQVRSAAYAGKLCSAG
ncbi:hypothetical protein FAF44_30440 [Nonomuraea sp. MG754425]|uniref:DUF6355 family natural product biosynthesis protein n=1 Tax=Nonomuraea sp. MG754425 TaxID=2570319 RepID=UPI001F239D8E|nr:DUF6355 family natural product biosynthesis protein [Nonomuraea sp. MG754425]MCF6472683.1 hypothetical protein [Nonomuraea sp. MG754425]